jgi:tetratricopeptide (TPR) repeat protein
LIGLTLAALAAACTPTAVQRPAKTAQGPAAVENAVEQRAYAAVKSGDVLAGITLYEEILRENPHHPKAHYMVGYAYGLLGEIESEIAHYRAALASGYRDDQLFHNLGKACLSLNRPEEAVAAFESGLALNPRSADNHFGLAMAYQRLFDHAGCQRELLTAVRLAPDVLEFREYLGLYYEETGRLDLAVEQFRAIVARDPRRDGAREHLAYLLRLKSRGDGLAGSSGP